LGMASMEAMYPKRKRAVDTASTEICTAGYVDSGHATRSGSESARAKETMIYALNQ